MVIFEKNFEYHKSGEFVKVRKFTLVIIVICPKNDNFGLKMKILKFLGIQAIYDSRFPLVNPRF